MPTSAAHFPAVLLALLLAAGPLRAGGLPPDPPGPAPRLDLDWKDAGWVAAGTLLGVGSQIRYRDMQPVDTGSLDRQDLWDMDRWVAGTYSSGVALASDILIIPFSILPVALSAWDAQRGGQGFGPVGTDALILGEALAINGSLSLLVRSLKIHPRPFVYGDEAPARDKRAGEASGSFFSGHASSAFLAGTYLAYTYPLRHPGFTAKGPLWAGCLGTAALIGGLRVAAGKHFPSDVAAGAAIGSFLGWFVPRMHLSRAEGPADGLRLGIDARRGGPVLSYRW